MADARERDGPGTVDAGPLEIGARGERDGEEVLEPPDGDVRQARPVELARPRAFDGGRQRVEKVRADACDRRVIGVHGTGACFEVTDPVKGEGE